MQQHEMLTKITGDNLSYRLRYRIEVLARGIANIKANPLLCLFAG